MSEWNTTGTQGRTVDDSSSTGIDLDRRSILKATGIGTAGLLVGFAASPIASAAENGGPVVLMGIDAEDGGPGAHGANTIYQGVVNDILANVTNGQSDILAIGAKDSTHTGAFWDAIETGTSTPVDFVSGETAIRNADFSSYAMVGVVSSQPETPFGGLTNAENDAVIDRAADLATFVNGGGGLLGFSQAGLTSPWAYLGDLGAFTTVNNLSYSDVTATGEGNAVGITDTNLDLCCWHDTFTEWPAFLDVLAWRTGYIDTQAAALGGASVIIATCPVSETSLIAGQDDDIGTVTVEQTEEGGSLFITYTTTGDWYMTETHLHVAEDCSDIPQTGSGNPKVGNFEFSATHDPPVQEYTVEVPLDSDWEPGDDLCIAAHADVFCDINDNGVFDADVDREETAWGEGELFTQRGNWAMHFDYQVCDE